MTWVDPAGKLLTEIRDGVTGFANLKVRVSEPDQGDAPPMVIIRPAPLTLMGPRVPVVRHGYFIQCYGTTPKQAEELGLAVSAVVNNVLPRQSAGGTAIYQSLLEVGGQLQVDPDTSWPFTLVISNALASTESVPA